MYIYDYSYNKCKRNLLFWNENAREIHSFINKFQTQVQNDFQCWIKLQQLKKEQKKENPIINILENWEKKLSKPREHLQVWVFHSCNSKLLLVENETPPPLLVGHLSSSNKKEENIICLKSLSLNEVETIN